MRNTPDESLVGARARRASTCVMRGAIAQYIDVVEPVRVSKTLAAGHAPTRLLALLCAHAGQARRRRAALSGVVSANVCFAELIVARCRSRTRFSRWRARRRRRGRCRRRRR